MANNITTGGFTYASDDLNNTGVHYQRVKLVWGGEDVANDPTATAGFPVNLVASGGSGVQTSGTLSAAGASTLTGGVGTNTTSTVVIDVGNAGNVSFHLVTSAFVGTVVFEQSFDPAGGAGTWGAIPVNPEDQGSAPMSSLAINTAAAYIRQFTQDMFGPKLFRIRVSAFTSGTLAVLASAGPGWVAANPSLAPGNALIGQVDPACGSTGALVSGTTSGTANTNTVALAADVTRKGMMIWNTGTAPIRLGFGVATSGTLYAALVNPGTGYEVPDAYAKLALNVSSGTASVGYNVQSVT